MLNFFLSGLFLALLVLPAMATPMVTNKTPSAGETSVLEGTSVSTTFSEAVNPATLRFTLEKQVGIVAVAANTYHTVALKGDGTVMAWGANNYGQTTVPAGLSGIIAIAAGEWHSMALKGDGTVVAWGNNDHGQISVPAGLSGVVAIAAGEWHSVALKGDGTVIAWGDNSSGQTTVPAGLSGVEAIAAGKLTTFALKEDGTLISWGYELYPFSADLTGVIAIAAEHWHMLALKADGTVVAAGATAYGPLDTPSGLAGVTAIAVGYNHAIALKEDGTVVTWGDNGYGQTTVPDGASGIVAIAAGAYNSFAIKADGTLVSWGLNDRSSLDSGQTDAPSGFSTVIDMDADIYHTVALKGDGTVVAWGSSINGPAGTSIPAGLSQVSAIAAGWLFTVLAKENGNVVAWGDNHFGQIDIPAGLSSVVDVAAGADFAAALKADGTVVAWGDNTMGQTSIPPGLTRVVAIAAGYQSMIALKDDGTVATWGNTWPAPAGLSGVVAVAAGQGDTIALKDDGTVVVWGSNTYGELTLPAGLSGVVAVAAGNGHFVVLRDDGTVVAWGADYFGQAQVPPGLSDVVSIAAGSDSSVALKRDGTVVAWGRNTHSQAMVPTALTPYTTSIAGSTTYYANTNTATFIPDVPLDQNSVYHVTTYGVTDGIQTSGGANWRFSTGDSLQPYLVTPKAGRHGKMNPALGRLVTSGATTGFLITPDAGYQIDTVSGCGGWLSGNTYTTGTITGACEIVAAFLPKNIPAPASIAIPATDNDGSYTVNWGASANPRVTYVLQEATNASFTANLRQVYSGTGTSASISGRSSGVTYYYRVRAIRAGYTDSSYRVGTNGCVVTLPCSVPVSIAVPVANTTGSYPVRWGASTTPGVTYVLQEATDASFTTNLRQAYLGTGTSASITGRSSGTTYYYRVRAQRSGYSASNYRIAGNSCTVTLPCAAPTSLTVPVSNATGRYTVNWSASTTPGVTYVLQEATNATFTANLRQAYSGTAISASISGRSSGATYYYRVRAQRSRYTTSSYRAAGSGCAVTIPCAAPATITVPKSNSSGDYTVFWTASATAGVTYTLEESTDNFKANSKVITTGLTATSANIAGQFNGKTYWYRVKAIRTNYRDSLWTTSEHGCVVSLMFSSPPQ
jgi:alpha-tubulin suppressor-like RCC1 family protein